MPLPARWAAPEARWAAPVMPGLPATTRTARDHLWAVGGRGRHQVATSSTYGAPNVERKNSQNGPTISGGMMERREGGGSAAAPGTDVSVAAALASAISGDEGARLVARLVLLLAVSVAALAVSASRYRRRTA